MEAEMVLRKSETIGKLSEALSKAQGLIEGASKDSKNPFYNSKYADLASVWDCCRRPLSENGLAVLQIPAFDGSNVHVETMLSHASGEWISGTLSLQPVKEVKGGGSEPWLTPQGVGSAISYARRYGLASMVGIYQEDDDANSSSQKKELKPDPAFAKKLESLERKQPTTPAPQAQPLTAPPPKAVGSAGESTGIVEKLAAKQSQKNGKPYMIFTFNGNSVTTWDTAIFPFLTAHEGKRITAVIEQKGNYYNLIACRQADPEKQPAEWDAVSDITNEDIPF